MSDGCYLYAITPGRAPWTGSGRGVDGAALRTIETAGLRAFVSGFDAGADAGSAAPDDARRLARRVRQHDAVLRTVGARHALVPLRFGTILPGEGAVRELLRSQAPRLSAQLRRLQGAAEWGVKGWWSEGPAHGDTGLTPPEPVEPGSGAGYLRDRQRQLEAARTAGAWREALLDACHRRLAERARAAALLPLRRAEPPGAPPLAFNGSYLVPETARAAFAAAVGSLSDAHADQGLRLELTGPWPPYSFAGDALPAGAPS